MTVDLEKIVAIDVHTHAERNEPARQREAEHDPQRRLQSDDVGRVARGKR